MSNISFLPEDDAALINPEDVAGLIAAGVISPEQPGLRTAPATDGGTGGSTGGGQTILPDFLTPAQLLAEKNRSRLGDVAAAANRAGSFVTGASQEEVDAILAGVESGIYSADDALGRLSNIESANRSSTGDSNGSTDDDPEVEQRRVDAFARLRSLLNRYNLGALEGNVRDLIARGITDGDAVLFELRETESFKTRFKANAKRAAAGLPELDPATYIGLENSYRSVLASNNLPIGFYDDQDDFNAFIEGAVSPGELQSRISDGYRKVQDADPEVKRQMQELYGVAEPELLAYFLDPKRARPLLDSAALRRQAEAAAIAARGREQGGLTLTRESAEALAARGITPEEAATQFAQRGALAGLYNPLTGEEGLTQEEELGATFGFDPVAAQKLERRRAQRRAEFQGGGQFARTTGATSGTVETGIGTAS